MLTIVVATSNPGKLREFQDLLVGLPLQLVPLNAVGVKSPDESGTTFLENARIKALHAVGASGMPALADDSGLTVDVLNGAPGIYSARYAGPDADDAANRARLLRELDQIPLDRRTARFHCALVLAAPGPASPREVAAVEAAVSGAILSAPKGDLGFGYDSLFLLPELGLTFGEMPDAQKGRHSHRARAVEQLLPTLRDFARQIRAGQPAWQGSEA